jgi:hypothetical protein
LPLAKQKFHSVKIEFSQTKKNCSWLYKKAKISFREDSIFT